MSAPNKREAAPSTMTPCFDAFGRAREIETCADIANGRVLLALPPGEGLRLTPAQARQLADLLTASADVIEQPIATRGTVAKLPSARVPSATSRAPWDQRTAGSASPPLRAVRS